MTPSERANLPRWHGQAGFYEIWFYVIFDPNAERAFWLRFTTFAPVAGTPLSMQWIAVFNRERGRPAVAKSVSAARDGYTSAPDRFELRFGTSRLDQRSLAGNVDNGRHRIEWELAFDPVDEPRHPLPALFDRIPSPVHVAHAQSAVRFSGHVTVDGRSILLSNAPGLQKHIWGRRVVERLEWLHCSRFESDRELDVEVTSVRLRERFPPTLAFAEAHRAGRRLLGPNPIRTRIERTADFALCAVSPGLRWHARCLPEMLVGYKYRDPRGPEVFVAQSDVGDSELVLDDRTFVSRGTTALEFHGKEPLPGVGYIEFESTHSGA